MAHAPGVCSWAPPEGRLGVAVPRWSQCHSCQPWPHTTLSPGLSLPTSLSLCKEGLLFPTGTPIPCTHHSGCTWKEAPTQNPLGLQGPLCFHCVNAQRQRLQGTGGWKGKGKMEGGEQHEDAGEL